MSTVKYRTLMVNNQFIDYQRLTKGIFISDSPKLFSLELDEERLFDDHFEEVIMSGAKRMDVDRFHDNWKKCKLVTIEIKIT